MAELIITINEVGETSLEVTGASGSGCRKVTENLEKALGTIVASARKPEYNDCADASCTGSST